MMPLKENLSVCSIVILFCLAAIFMGCMSGGEPVSTTRIVPTETITIAGWCEGGPGVIAPEDVGCYLESAAQEEIYWIDEETAVLHAESQSVENWAGAAVIYHSPSGSMLVFDRLGDILPQASVFTSRAGLAVFEELSLDEGLMTDLKSQVQERWQTTPSNQPEIRLGTAWQEGRTAIFLVAIAGVRIDDAGFYCPSQTWTMGEITIQIEALCITYVPGTPVAQFFFQSHEIEPDVELTVKVALDGWMSNEVKVGSE